MSEGEYVSYEEFKKLKDWYMEVVRKKDAEIDRLREENKALMSSALKQAEMNLPPQQQEERLFGQGYKSDLPEDIEKPSKDKSTPHCRKDNTSSQK